MRYVVVAVSDRAVGAFNRPFFAPTVGAAVRAFSDEVNRSGSEMNGHPEDYELHQLAEWTDEDGKFSVPDAGVRMIVRAKDVVKGDRHVQE